MWRGIRGGRRAWEHERRRPPGPLLLSSASARMHQRGGGAMMPTLRKSAGRQPMCASVYESAASRLLLCTRATGLTIMLPVLSGYTKARLNRQARSRQVGSASLTKSTISRKLVSAQTYSCTPPAGVEANSSDLGSASSSRRATLQEEPATRTSESDQIEGTPAID